MYTFIIIIFFGCSLRPHDPKKIVRQYFKVLIIILMRRKFRRITNLLNLIFSNLNYKLLYSDSEKRARVSAASSGPSENSEKRNHNKPKFQGISKYEKKVLAKEYLWQLYSDFNLVPQVIK